MMTRILTLACTLFLLVPSSANAAPSQEIHSLDWYVHVDLIDVGAGQDLAYFTQLINDRVAQANVLLQGHQGPFDAGCCVALDAVTVSTFGTPGDGLDVVANSTQFSALQAFGDGAYLIQTLNYCAGTISTGIQGCADQPGDFLVVQLDADASKFLPTVIAHERGHNANLSHVSANACELMQGSRGGGCLSVSYCNSYIAKADTTSGTCDCLADTVGDDPLPLGASCGGSDVCSEGICDADTSLAGIEVLLAGGLGASTGVTTDTTLQQSGIAGGYSTIGGAGATISGLAYDHDDDVLYGIEVLAGDDALVTLDPSTGAKIATVGTLSGRDQVIALAFDPQVSGDRLFGIHVDDDFFGTDCATIGPNPPCISELFEIDPSNASVTRLGELNSLIIEDGVTGIAWDDTNGVLYGATPAGLASLDLGTCDGFTCGATSLDNVFRVQPGLTWDPGTGKLLREGDTGFGGTEIDIIDVTNGIESTIGIDPVTVGGLAVPEPGVLPGLVVGCAGLAVLGRRRLSGS